MSGTGACVNAELSSVRTVLLQRCGMSCCARCCRALPEALSATQGRRQWAAAGRPQLSCCPPRSTRSCTCSGWRAQPQPQPLSQPQRCSRGQTWTRRSAPGSSSACVGQRSTSHSHPAQSEPLAAPAPPQHPTAGPGKAKQGGFKQVAPPAHGDVLTWVEAPAEHTTTFPDAQPQRVGFSAPVPAGTAMHPPTPHTAPSKGLTAGLLPNTAGPLCVLGDGEAALNCRLNCSIPPACL